MKEEIADEADTGAEAVDGLAEFQVRQHPQLGKSKVHPVKVGEHIAKEKKGNQTPRHLGIGAVHGIGLRGDIAIGGL